jgi:mannose-1-phosphate guanylyltransferase
MNNPHLYAVIMAGGKGQRLWPLSREDRPKQALTLQGKRSLFQLAVDRLLPLIPAERILVVTVSDYVELLREQAPEVPLANYVVEPLQRGTGPAIGLSAQALVQRDPDAVMAVVTADHYIEQVERFRAVLEAAAQVAAGNWLVTLGIRPSYPSTGYGYIERGPALQRADGFVAYHVTRFAEKPSAEVASEMVASGRYSWNSGMFIWRAEHILCAFSQHMPEFRTQLERIGPLLGDPERTAEVLDIWKQVKTQTIDYGIMERAQDAAVIPVDLGWSDVGSWETLLDVLSSDAAGNVVHGDLMAVDTERTLLHSTTGRLVATIGLEDLVIVDTDDVLLICRASRAQDVRKVVTKLKEQGRTEYL